MMNFVNIYIYIHIYDIVNYISNLLSGPLFAYNKTKNKIIFTNKLYLQMVSVIHIINISRILNFTNGQPVKHQTKEISRLFHHVDRRHALAAGLGLAVINGLSCNMTYRCRSSAWGMDQMNHLKQLLHL